MDVLAGHLNFFKADTAPHNGIHTRVLPSQCFNPTFVALHWLQQRGVGLAVNSKQHRTQDQLHIHIECLGAEVYRVLRTAGERRSDRGVVIRLAQWRYQGMRVMGEGLEQTHRGRWIHPSHEQECAGRRDSVGFNLRNRQSLGDRQGRTTSWQPLGIIEFTSRRRRDRRLWHALD